MLKIARIFLAQVCQIQTGCRFPISQGCALHLRLLLGFGLSDCWRCLGLHWRSLNLINFSWQQNAWWVDELYIYRNCFLNTSSQIPNLSTIWMDIWYLDCSIIMVAMSKDSESERFRIEWYLAGIACRRLVMEFYRVRSVNFKINQVMLEISDSPLGCPLFCLSDVDLETHRKHQQTTGATRWRVGETHRSRPGRRHNGLPTLFENSMGFFSSSFVCFC